MESIYRNIIIRTKRNLSKGFCLFLSMVLLCTLSGCGLEKRMAAETVTEEESRVNEEVKTEEGRADGDGPETLDSFRAERADKEEDVSQEEEEKPTTMSQLLGESESETDASPDTVLWFNATYAPLTYSNAGNWRLVGGVQPSTYNKKLVQALILRDWDIQDRDSALKTVEWLKKEGHRARCQEYMEELQEMGMLDMDAETFLQALMDTGIEENLFRYVMVYDMYHNGQDANAIAAWDLCRVNQLYGDFYICGYMTYEEAMDASLENSLVLQKMYPSWEAMVGSYMMGYQFWQSDPCLTEDSPTLKRYGYYEILLETENGPYTLDWDMELTKSW